MADKANGQTGTKKSMTKTEAVRRALAEFGPTAKLSEMQSFIKDRFGVEMSTNHISTSRGEILRKEAAGKATTATTTIPAAKKPVASKPAPKKPSAQQAAARSNAPPKGSNAGRGISLDDVQTVKALVGRVGAEQLRSLIDLLAR